MYEKRVHIRIPAGIEGSYQPISRLEEPHLGITRDISLGGARFSASSRLEAGDKISIVLALPKQGNMTLTGLVVWSRSSEEGRAGVPAYEVGLSWEDVDAHAQARLNSFLIDCTRQEPVIITSGPAPSNLSWLRLAAFSLITAFLLGAAVVVYVTLYQVTSENKSLKQAVGSYQHLIEHVALRSRPI